VLGGAIAAGRRARIYDAVVLKTFGATRFAVMGAYLAEFAVLGLFTAIFAVFAGSLAAYFVTVEAMDVDFSFFASVALSIIALGVIATVVVGFIGTWTALGAKAAPILRSP
ncbi:MAG: ABC transporter permease, partial [Rhizobiales bacterium]|nr:ABC transporter permease [Hyphomicrobiales bacterium]